MSRIGPVEVHRLSCAGCAHSKVHLVEGGQDPTHEYYCTHPNYLGVAEYSVKTTYFGRCVGLDEWTPGWCPALPKGKDETVQLTQDEKDLIVRYRKNQQEKKDRQKSIVSLIELAATYQEWLYQSDFEDSKETFCNEFSPKATGPKGDDYYYVYAILKEAHKLVE